MLSKKNKTLILDASILALSLVLSLVVLVVSSLGLLMICGLIGYAYVAIYAEESITNKIPEIHNVIWFTIPYFLLFLHFLLTSYYHVKRKIIRGFEKIMDWIGEKYIKDEITEEMILEFMKNYNIVNHTSEIPFEEIKDHFKKYNENDVIDCLTIMMSEAKIYEPKMNILKLIE